MNLFKLFFKESYEYIIKNANIGKKNTYICSINHRTVTIHKDNGVTPFIIDCEYEECYRDAKSLFYSEKCQKENPEYEWYRPYFLKYLFMKEYNKDHYRNGGLWLRKIKK